MIFAIFFPALAGVVVWWFFGSKENRAMRAKTTRLMVAYSSVAQIGYIFAAMGIRS